MKVPEVMVGCAGWQLPAHLRPETEGSALSRYAQRFNCVEINSTFKSVHRPQTFERWASSVPKYFKFSVKAPKAITHDKTLVDCASELETFLRSVSLLDAHLGPLLFQFAPSFAFEFSVVDTFLSLLRKQCSQAVVFEPRHPSWGSAEADSLLSGYSVARAATDPIAIPGGGQPRGSSQFAYFRFHGSPRTYFSSYSEEFLDGLHQRLISGTQFKSQWCIFDNTGAGAAAANALSLNGRLNDESLDLAKG
ncbi:MAG: DUF72 domain-containing protein [Bdellovibrionota bacterium]